MGGDVALEVRLRKRLSQNGGPGFELQAELAAPPGITILFGPSGAGKTTLLECVAGLLRPDGGRIAVGSKVFFDSERQTDLAVERRSVGYVFQTLALFPHLTVDQNVAYGLAGLGPEERRRRTEAVLESFHIAHLAGRQPAEISGGERQRTALARALVIEPSLLLLDEPLSALDRAVKAKIIEDLRAWIARHPIPALYVTHDRDEVFALGERVIFLEQGRVVASGTPREVLEAPRREVIAQAAGFENIFDATVTALHPAQGTMSCRLAGSQAELEVPLVRLEAGAPVRVAVRAGDILLATAPPSQLSARNVIEGRISGLRQVDVTLVARVECGVEFEVHLTPGAAQALRLEPGTRVWLVLKTYSCHLLAEDAVTPSRIIR
ncbi:MAG TPA: molybdenum ABC transporter ATP-binding protein [Terriglobales bacterium]|nr:molybdenum ABC transporter ATP-binding protein [Terriglobales bacterium]